MAVCVFHIIEAFGAGTLIALSGVCCNTETDIRHMVAHSIRPETPAEYCGLFPAGTNFYKLNMQREIHPFKDSRAFFDLVTALKKIRPDVVHCHSSKSGVLGRIAAWHARIPSVYTPHSYSFLQEGISGLQKRFYYLVETGVSRFGTVIAACGAHEYALAREIAGDSAWVVQIDNGIDVAKLSEVVPVKNEGDFPVIGMSGRYVLQRNPEMFMALAEALRAKSGWIWIGADKGQPGFSDHVAATGWLPRHETLARVAGLDIYLQTSLWEGLSYGILEAMALGKPIVASRIPANESIVKHGITGFLAKDKNEFLSYLTMLVESPGLREEMGRAGKEYARENHNIQDAARKYAALYRDVAEGRKPGCLA